MAFNPEGCYIPTVYCGQQERKYPYVENDNLYTGKGTTDQCMRKGFGAALARENKKKVSADSLQQIRYVGPLFDTNFKKENINTLPQLLAFAKRVSQKQIETIFKRVFQNSNGTLNGKGYNSALLYLYRNGNSRLPKCVKL